MPDLFPISENGKLPFPPRGGKGPGGGVGRHVTRFFTTEDTEGTEFWIFRRETRHVQRAANESEITLHVSSPSLTPRGGGRGEGLAGGRAWRAGGWGRHLRCGRYSVTPLQSDYRRGPGGGVGRHVTRFFTTEDTEGTEFWIFRRETRHVQRAADENEITLHVSSPSLTPRGGGRGEGLAGGWGWHLQCGRYSVTPLRFSTNWNGGRGPGQGLTGRGGEVRNASDSPSSPALQASAADQPIAPAPGPGDLRWAARRDNRPAPRCDRAPPG